MKIINKLKQRIESLLFTPGEELGRWARFLRFQIQLWKFCARRLSKNNAMAMSAALSFRTIFALIPTIVLIVVTLKSYGGVERAKGSLNDLMVVAGIANITTDGVDGQEVQSVSNVISELVDNISGMLTFETLGTTGILLLIWASITLLTTMERSLNRIYGARSNRAIGKRILFYWSVITLGPLVLTAANYMFKNMRESFPVAGFWAGLLGFTSWLGPVIVGVILLGLLYKMMPNTRVGLRAAMVGALIAVPLWLLAKWGFGIYVKQVSGKSLYGALGLLPLFLMWVNLSWLIFLFGAEVSHTAANLSTMQQAEMASRIRLKPTDMLAAAIVVANGYQDGNGAVEFSHIRDKLSLPDQSLNILLERLVENGVLCAIESEKDQAYLPAKPLTSICIGTIVELNDWDVHINENNPNKKLALAIDKFKQRTDGNLSAMTLDDLC
ncbi:MAG: YihY/virulence factor BrkB family protein [Phycisphaerae bacterium]|nr:YihY/virulence factor BrkB family protein [Phycisphaerae bacterium]